MKVVRPYGVSKTDHVRADVRVRRIHPNSFRNEAQDVANFAVSHSKLILAQWISLIDKVITKPSKGGAPSVDQFNLRNGIGESVWELFLSKDLLNAPTTKRLKRLEREWWSNIHPYGSDIDPTGIMNFKGRWFKVFCEEIEPAKVDFELIALALHDHLYSRERRLGGSSTARARGLILARADSIDCNVLKERQQPLSFGTPWNDDEIKQYETATNLVDELKSAAKKYEGQRAARTRRAIGQVFHNHYGKLFVDDDGKPINVAMAQKAFPGLFALHEAAKSNIKRILKAPQDHWLKKFPDSPGSFMEYLSDDWRNKEVNHLIRLGKVIHYEAAKLGGADRPSQIFDNWSGNFSTSAFWSTDGQIAIKHSEAFVRNWRTIVSFASRSITNWADPNSAIEKDILGRREILRAVENLSIAEFDRLASIYFGNSVERFATTSRAYRQDVMKLALLGLSRLRNSTFHFSGLSSFLDALHSLPEDCNEAVADAVRGFYIDDINAHAQHLSEKLRSVDVEHFLEQDQVDSLCHVLIDSKVYFNDLPNFQSILRRGQDAYLSRKIDMRLPSAATRLSLDNNSAKCRHLILKLLYEGPFAKWLCNLPSDMLNEFVNQHIVRSTNEARRIGENDKHIARAAGTIKIQENDTIFDLFSMLRRLSLSEARESQKQSVSKRNMGKYLRKLELDVIAQAFQHFVEANYFDWIFDLRDSQLSKHRKSKLPKHKSDIGSQELWPSILYFLLHFVPVDEVNKLSHQISRSNIGNLDEAQTASPLLSVFRLYEKMHDAKFKGLEGADGRDTLQPLFESSSLSESLLNAAASNSMAGRGSVRALREMLRFEPPPNVLNGFGAIPVKNSHLDQYHGLIKEIGAAQHTKRQLHNKWVESGNSLNVKDIETYRDCLELISNYRFNTHHVHLTNHLKAFQLLVSAHTKLTDYSVAWERDLYFVTLAIIHKLDGKPEDVFASERSQLLLGRGQIIAALRAKETNELSNKLMEALSLFFGLNFEQNMEPHRTTRNKLAHFGLLRGSTDQISLTKTINDTRHLVSYDKKRTNRVSVSIKDIFMSFGVDVSWESKNGMLCRSNVKARTIKHLNREDVVEPYVGPEFIELVKTFL